MTFTSMWFSYRHRSGTTKYSHSKPPANDIKDIMLTVSPLIDVEYQGESVVVLKADENALLLSNGTLIPFWNAVDVVKRYGYSLIDVTISIIVAF